MGGRPRKLSHEIEDWLEREFFYSKNNTETDLQKKIKKKFNISVDVGVIKKSISTFFLPNGKVKVSRNLANERKKRENGKNNRTS